MARIQNEVRDAIHAKLGPSKTLEVRRAVLAKLDATKAKKKATPAIKGKVGIKSKKK